MAVEMEKEKQELVIPKPSNPWKFTGIPLGILSTSLDSNKWLKPFPRAPPNRDTENKQKTKKKEPKILGNRTRSRSDEDNMRDWGGFPSFFFSFFFP